MKALLLSRPIKVILFVMLALAITASLANAWGNYQQEEFEKMLKGKAPIRKGAVNPQVRRMRRGMRDERC